MAPQIKLTYFDAPGRAELPRLMLHYGGVAFTDERIDHAKFGALKPTLPLGQLPVLEVDGETFSQSMAIARYTAKLSGLYPSDPVEALRVDMVVDSVGELIAVIPEIAFSEKDEAVKAEKSKVFVETTVPKILNALEGMVKGDFFLGSAVTLADFIVFDIVTNGLQPLFAAFSIAPFPKLSAVIANVQALPAVAAYLAK